MSSHFPIHVFTTNYMQMCMNTLSVIFDVISDSYIYIIMHVCWCTQQLHRCRDKDKDYLISIGMVGDLKNIVDGFMYNADLIAEAFSVIACLSDMGKSL